MVIREARYLSGNDLGKTVGIAVPYTYIRNRGELVEVAHYRTTTMICIKNTDSGRTWTYELNGHMPVAITGKERMDR